MANFVANTIVLGSAPTNEQDVCFAIVGYKNDIPSSTYSGEAADANYPFTNCLDYRDNTQYSPSASSGSVQIVISKASLFTVDYFGLALHNGFSAGLTGKVEMQNVSSGAYEEIATFTPYGTNKTICEYFGEKQAYRFRITLNFTSKLYIGALYLGKAWSLGRQPDIGLKPASLNNVDEVVGFTDNNGQFTIGRVETVGFDTDATFSLIPMVGTNGIRSNWPNFQTHCKLSRPFFFKWSVSNNDNTFGQYKNPSSMPDMTYTTSYHGQVPIKMRGRD